VRLPVVEVDPFALSAPAKLSHALAHFDGAANMRI
jgi:hypothetical protein